MPCGFRDTCGCGYHFVSSNINLVWKRQLRGGVQATGEQDPDETATATGGINTHATVFYFNILSVTSKRQWRLQGGDGRNLRPI